ncbi:MAG TPA: DUF1349 domain-containing protein, partial [bacterium]|nr:DUF1349 domain-containing protein [bacterium]
LAGRGLSAVLGLLINPNKEGANALRKMGRTVNDVNPELHGLKGALEGLKGMSTQDLAKMFGASNLDVVLSLLNNLSGEKGLEIRPEPGGLMGDGQDAKNILVKPLPPDAYLVTVYVQANHRSQYEQGGLILYLDDNNYIKFVLEMVDGKHWFVLVCELDAKPKVINKLPASEKGGWIILQLKDQTVTAFSCDGKVGTVKIGTADFPMEPRPRIGIFTQSGEPGSDRWVTFRDFVIYKATE